jgi:hypothetical protein
MSFETECEISRAVSFCSITAFKSRYFKYEILIHTIFLVKTELHLLNFYSRTVHFDIIKILLPTDAQENRFTRSIKIYIKTAPPCFGVITIIREGTI